MFEGCLNYSILWSLWHIVWCTDWYNAICFWSFYYAKTKPFCRGFSAIDNLYITLYRSGVDEHSDVEEHLGVWSSIQLCSSNLVGIYFNFFCPHVHIGVSCDHGNIFRIINKCFCIIMVNSHETWVHCGWWEVVINTQMYVFYLWFSDCVFVCIFK